MKRLTVVLLSALFVWTGAVGSVAAQEDATVEVVDFETADVDEEVTDAFYGHLQEVFAGRDGVTVGDVANVSMDELLLMAGCNAPDTECLTTIGDLVEADRLVFGSIERSDDVLMFSLNFFDFEAGEMIREVSEQTLRGDRDWLADGMPAVAEHLVYGPTATVHIEAPGAPEAQLRVNGETVGTGSATVDDVSPGEVVVLARAGDDEEQKERFILRHDEERDVQLDFADEVDDIDDPGVASRSLTPGLALTGAGVAGTVLGMVGQIRLSSANADADNLIGDRGAVDPDERDQLDDLDSRMTTGNTMRWLGFGTGIAGLAGGGFLLYRAITDDRGTGGDDLAGQTDVSLDVGASDEGVNAGFRMRF